MLGQIGITPVSLQNEPEPLDNTSQLAPAYNGGLLPKQQAALAKLNQASQNAAMKVAGLQVDANKDRPQLSFSAPNLFAGIAQGINNAHNLKQAHEHNNLMSGLVHDLQDAQQQQQQAVNDTFQAQQQKALEEQAQILTVATQLDKQYPGENRGFYYTNDANYRKAFANHLAEAGAAADVKAETDMQKFGRAIKLLGVDLTKPETYKNRVYSPLERNMFNLQFGFFPEDLKDQAKRFAQTDTAANEAFKSGEDAKQSRYKTLTQPGDHALKVRGDEEDIRGKVFSNTKAAIDNMFEPDVKKAQLEKEGYSNQVIADRLDKDHHLQEFAQKSLENFQNGSQALTPENIAKADATIKSLGGNFSFAQEFHTLVNPKAGAKVDYGKIMTPPAGSVHIGGGVHFNPQTNTFHAHVDDHHPSQSAVNHGSKGPEHHYQYRDPLTGQGRDTPLTLQEQKAEKQQYNNLQAQTHRELDAFKNGSANGLMFDTQNQAGQSRSDMTKPAPHGKRYQTESTRIGGKTYWRVVAR